MSDAGKIILARRARFVAAALASVALGSSCARDRGHGPVQCLSPLADPQEDGGPPPEPCLEPPNPPEVCLSQVPPPEVCLEAPEQPGDNFAKPPPG